MDQFSVFLSFYGLLLGLSAAEILSSLGLFVRTRTTARLELQGSLLAALVFLLVCGAWIDAWNLRRSLTMDVLSLAAPIGVATSYFIAAVVVLPREKEGIEDPERYFAERKRFVAGTLIVSELFYKIVLIPMFADTIEKAPMVFWLWSLPLNLAILAGFFAIFFARGRHANIAAILFQLIILTLSYLPNNLISNAIRAHYDYPALT